MKFLLLTFMYMYMLSSEKHHTTSIFCLLQQTNEIYISLLLKKMCLLQELQVTKRRDLVLSQHPNGYVLVNIVYDQVKNDMHCLLTFFHLL